MKKFNEWIALHATLAFGTMWVTYLFFLYGFLPVLFPDKMDTFMYWSNTVQLWSLPLLMVGQNILNRSSENRANNDHKATIQIRDTVMTELTMLREQLQIAKEERDVLKTLLQEIRQNQKTNDTD